MKRTTLIAMLVATVCGPVGQGTLCAATRIMPLGDSITHTLTGHASYRYWLWHQLSDATYSVNFVGSMYGHYGGPPLYDDFDQDHEGHWVWRADQILEHTLEWAMSFQPDIVLIHLGHNDLGQGQGVDSTIDDLAAIVADFRTVNPEIIVLIAQVIPSTQPQFSEIPELNAEIAVLAVLLDTPGSRVIAVDQWTGFDPVADTYDGTHPNEVGEQKMATRWFETLSQTLDPIGLVFQDGFESGDFGAWSSVTPLP